MKITEQYIKELLVKGENRTLEMKKCKDTLPESVWLTLPSTGGDNVTNSPENVIKEKDNVTNSPENVTKTKKRRDSVLEILKSDCAVTTDEIAEKLNVSKRTILRDLEFLSKSNIIKREGGSFGGKWIIIKLF